MSAAPPIERLLRREGAITIAGLFVLWALTWVYLAAGAGMGMTAWEMTRVALLPQYAAVPVDAMSMAWSAWDWAVVLGMWWTMMIAMMTPGAAPTILLYARVYRHAQGQGSLQATHAPTWAFVGGYFLAWLLFSIAATVLQQVLEAAGFISMMGMGSQVRWLSGTALILTGLYQLSPLKNACLSHCRAPAQFLSRHWRPGTAGALRLGIVHGGYCIGCCWLLMALLFVGGVMNLAWIAALSLLVLAERLLPAGEWVGRLAGLLLVGWGGAVLWG